MQCFSSRFSHTQSRQNAGLSHYCQQTRFFLAREMSNSLSIRNATGFNQETVRKRFGKRFAMDLDNRATTMWTGPLLFHHWILQCVPFYYRNWLLECEIRYKKPSNDFHCKCLRLPKRVLCISCALRKTTSAQPDRNQNLLGLIQSC